MSNTLHFLPWIGEGFKTSDSQRLLLLGESHYLKEDEANEPNFTRQMVEHAINSGYEKTNYFRTILEHGS